MAKLAKQTKVVKSAAEIKPNEMIEEVFVEQEVTPEVVELSIADKFLEQLDRVQLSNLSLEQRQTFTKQEVMAIVASVLK